PTPARRPDDRHDAPLPHQELRDAAPYPSARRGRRVGPPRGGGRDRPLRRDPSRPDGHLRRPPAGDLRDDLLPLRARREARRRRRERPRDHRLRLHRRDPRRPHQPRPRGLPPRRRRPRRADRLRPRRPRERRRRRYPRARLPRRRWTRILRPLSKPQTEGEPQDEPPPSGLPGVPPRDPPRRRGPLHHRRDLPRDLLREERRATSVTDRTYAVAIAPRKDSRTWSQEEIRFSDLVEWAENPADHKECG